MYLRGSNLEVHYLSLCITGVKNLGNCKSILLYVCMEPFYLDAATNINSPFFKGFSDAYSKLAYHLLHSCV
jgi:hypothetical protein